MSTDPHDLEARFLAGLNDAQDAYVQIIETQAWIALGHDSYADWWTARVVPVMRALSMRPTKEIAAAGIAQVREAESALPPAQRRTQREIADMFGVTQQAISARSTPHKNLSGADLEPEPTPEPVADPLTPEVMAQIEARIAEKQAPDPEQVATFARLDAQLEDEMAGTPERFRHEFATAKRKATELWSFDVDRLVEVFGHDYETEIAQFIGVMTAWCTDVASARRRATSGLRLVEGGRR